MNLAAPRMQPTDDRHWMLTSDYAVTLGPWRYDVRAGFETDGASIPRLLWRLLGHPLQGLTIGPAVVHDALYRSHMTSRRHADAVFYRLLRVNGVWAVKAWALWAGVRMGGWAPWANGGRRRHRTTDYIHIMRCPIEE
jgi:hypothetical protein